MDRQTAAGAPIEKPNVCAVAGTAIASSTRTTDFRRSTTRSPTHAEKVAAYGYGSLKRGCVRPAVAPAAARCSRPGRPRRAGSRLAGCGRRRAAAAANRRCRGNRGSRAYPREPESVAPKKNETGTSSASPTRTSRPAPTRFTPFSYFCTCWNVTPSRLPSSVCDMPLAIRRARMRWPTSTSWEVVLLAVDFVSIARRVPFAAPRGRLPVPSVSCSLRGCYREVPFAHCWLRPGGRGIVAGSC